MQFMKCLLHDLKLKPMSLKNKVYLDDYTAFILTTFFRQLTDKQFMHNNAKAHTENF